MRQHEYDALQDMLIYGNKVLNLVEGLSTEDLVEDEVVYAALVRFLEVIGEAATRLSKELRSQYPEIPWRAVVGMRNILIHSYDEIILDEVWAASVVSIPKLLPVIQTILESQSVD